MDTSAAPSNGNFQGAAELALQRRGFSGERLMKLARKVASDYLYGKAASLQDRREDLVSFLVLHGLQAALRYDPGRPHLSYGSNGGDPFQSYLSDVMEKRILDFYRRKSEGFGDRRYGNDGRLVLGEMQDEADPDVDFGKLISERRVMRWQVAAESVNLTLAEFMVITMDKAAKQIARTAT